MDTTKKKKTLLELSTKSYLLQASKAIMDRVKGILSKELGEIEIKSAVKLSKMIEEQVDKGLKAHLSLFEKKLDDLRKGYESGIKSLELLLKNLPTTILPKEAISVSVTMPQEVVKNIEYDSITGRPKSIVSKFE